MAALKFPDNRDVVTQGNIFSTFWLRWFGSIHRRLGGFDSLATIATADVTAAGATYDQTKMNEVITLLNEVKAKQNTTITTLQR